MSTAPGDVENAFSRSWQLLTSNWIIIVPGLIIGIVAGILTGIFYHPATMTYDANGVPQVSGAAAGAIGGALASIIAMVATVLTITYTTGMAGAAWATGRTTLADGSAAFKRDGAQVFLAMLGLFVVGFVAAILALPTLGLALLAYLVFFLYTMPGVVIGDRPGFTAMGESCQIALKRFVPTIITVLIIGVIAICSSFIAGALSFAPFIGPIVAAVIQQIVLAYVTLVIVGEYLAFRESPAAVPPGPPSAPPPVV